MAQINTRWPAALWPLFKTLIFFLIVPASVGGYIPYYLLGTPQIPAIADWRGAQWPGAALVVLGTLGLLWCGWNFAVTGRGTPAPFDAPRVLVVRGPYRWVRNPMYVSVATAVVGETLFFDSVALLQYLAVCWTILHMFVVFYEEPTLREKFGDSYAAYLRAVPRWIPRPPRGTP